MENFRIAAAGSTPAITFIYLGLAGNRRRPPRCWENFSAIPVFGAMQSGL